MTEKYTKAERITAERMGIPVQDVHEFLESYMGVCSDLSKENRERIQTELLKEKNEG